jgi:hypothetical protein
MKVRNTLQSGLETVDTTRIKYIINSKLIPITIHIGGNER